MMRLLIAALLSVAGATAVHLSASRAYAHDYSVGSITIAHPIVAPPPNGIDRTAGYMVLRNSGDMDDRLVSVTAPGAAQVEMHATDHGPGGVMRMRALPDGVVVPAHGEAVFAPHGLHLMVIGLAARLAEGDRLPLTLQFEHAGTVEVIAYVERPSATERSGHQH